MYILQCCSLLRYINSLRKTLVTNCSGNSSKYARSAHLRQLPQFFVISLNRKKIVLNSLFLVFKLAPKKSINNRTKRDMISGETILFTHGHKFLIIVFFLSISRPIDGQNVHPNRIARLVLSNFLVFNITFTRFCF